MASFHHHRSDAGMLPSSHAFPELAWHSHDFDLLDADALPEVATAKDIFSTLDDSVLTVSGLDWHIGIYSVVDDHGDRWVQLGLSGPRQHLATVRLDLGDGPRHVLSALASWLVDRSSTQNVTSVA